MSQRATALVGRFLHPSEWKRVVLFGTRCRLPARSALPVSRQPLSIPHAQKPGRIGPGRLGVPPSRLPSLRPNPRERNWQAASLARFPLLEIPLRDNSGRWQCIGWRCTLQSTPDNEPSLVGVAARHVKRGGGDSLSPMACQTLRRPATRHRYPGSRGQLRRPSSEAGVK